MSEDSQKLHSIHYIAPGAGTLVRTGIDTVPAKGSYVQVDGIPYEVAEVWHLISKKDTNVYVVSVYLEPVDFEATHAGGPVPG